VEEAEARRKATDARVGRLATIDPDGRPALVPFVFAVEGDTLFSAVDQKPKTTARLRRLDNIRRDPRVNVLIDHYEEDWSALWWVRLRGRARIVEAGVERDRALALLAEKYPHYREQAPTGPVVAVDVEEWRGWTGRSVQ
jgi:PPOX class probable F420-dependent enzyme